MEKQRCAYIDFLRIIAALFVIYNHTGTKGFLYYSIETDFSERAINMFFAFGCKVAVPVFFMISGAVLLGKQESIGEIWKKRIFRIVIVLLFFRLFNAIFSLWFRGIEFNVLETIMSIYTSDGDSYWYLQALIGTYIMLPFLRRMVLTMEKREYVYWIIMHIMWLSIRPMFEAVIVPGNTISPNMQISMLVANNIFYVVMGYYFHNKIEPNKKIAIFLCAGSLIMFLIVLVVTERQALLDGNYTEMYFMNFITLPTFLLWYIVKCIWHSNKVSFNSKFISSIGQTTFGVYLFEPTVRVFTERYIDEMIPLCGRSVSVCIWTVMVFMIGSTITYCLRRIPLIRKIL